MRTRAKLHGDRESDRNLSTLDFGWLGIGVFDFGCFEFERIRFDTF